MNNDTSLIATGTMMALGMLGTATALIMQRSQLEAQKEELSEHKRKTHEKIKNTAEYKAKKEKFLEYRKNRAAQFRNIGFYDDNDELQVKRIMKESPLPKGAIEMDDIKGSPGSMAEGVYAVGNHMTGERFIDNLEQINKRRVDQ